MSITIVPIPEQYVRIQDNLKEQHLDALVALSPENFYWISNALVQTMISIPDRLGAVLSILDEDPVMLICSIEDNIVTILVLRVDHRKKIYKKKV